MRQCGQVPALFGGALPVFLEGSDVDFESPGRFRLSWPIGLMLRAQLRGTRCYVAWGAPRTGRLFLLGSRNW